jgi:hypothetical protein
MKIANAILIVMFCLGLAALLPAAKIKEIELKNGYTDINRIGAPLFADAPALAIGTIASAYDKSGKIVRATSKNVFKMGPAYEIDPAVDLGALLGLALRSEATAMGFGTGDAWSVSGSLKDFYVETKQPSGFAAVQYYGVMTVEMEVRQGGGSPSTLAWTIYSYNQAYNAGMGRKDETRDAIARQLIEGAQEILARLNREHFHAAPKADLAKGLKVPLEDREGDLHRLGLSGQRSAVPLLLEWLGKEKDEDAREWVILALGRIADPAAVPTLTARYAKEESTCRWHTLKALAAIGTTEGMALIKGEGLQDEGEDIQRLAGKLTGQ